MERWARFNHKGDVKFGVFDEKNSLVTVYEGDMFNKPTETKEQIHTNDLETL